MEVAIKVAIFKSFFCNLFFTLFYFNILNDGRTHAAFLESLERGKHGSKRKGSLSTSVQDDANDWSNLRESCGDWLKLQHRPEFAGDWLKLR